MSARKNVPEKMPPYIMLGMKKIKMRLGTEDLPNDRYAHYDAMRGEIVFNANTKAEDMGDTVLHEFVHVSMETRGVGLSSRAEEHVATVLGSDLCELICRNPELIDWIRKGCPR